MQVKKTNTSPTQVTLTVVASEKELLPIKDHTLTHFQGKVKVAGFREGKVPANVLEKHVDPQQLQAEFLNEAIEQLYISAAQDQKLRPVDQPQISIKKFVPFTTLEFEAEVAVLGTVKLPDYKKIKLTRAKTAVTDKDVAEVIESLRTRLSEKKDVTRAAKENDQVYIDFTGSDAKTKESINGADGKDYPLIIGSNTFIPGFEPQLIGMKAGEEKTFDVTFPKDYGVETLKNRKVTFKVHVIKVQELVLSKVDDAFAAKAGPFKTAAEMKKDIKRQLTEEKQYKEDRDYESDLVRKITEKSNVDVPEVLVNDQVERLLHELKQNLLYRGQTMQEFLAAEGKDEEAYKNDVLRAQAAERVKASLVLAEIAELENLQVTPEELEVRLQVLKGQYQDSQMQEELKKPEARRDIAARMLTEKTVQKLVSYATK
jgi:trigger factor